MPIFGITRAGLITLSLAVSALWACIALEQRELRHAKRDLAAAIRMQNRLRERVAPADEAFPRPRAPWFRALPSVS